MRGNRSKSTIRLCLHMPGEGDRVGGEGGVCVQSTIVLPF